MTSKEQQLREIREEFNQEYIHLQIVGRELTQEERRRSEVLSKVVKLLDEALEVLGQKQPS